MCVRACACVCVCVCVKVVACGMTGHARWWTEPFVGCGASGPGGSRGSAVQCSAGSDVM